LYLIGAHSQQTVRKMFTLLTFYRSNNYDNRCRERITSIHRAAEKGCSRKLGFRYTGFAETS
jgi:hypothetical protein